ncbi:MAG: hypothetical protein ACLT3Y_05495 [Ruminococcus callidus]
MAQTARNACRTEPYVPAKPCAIRQNRKARRLFPLESGSDFSAVETGVGRPWTICSSGA